MESSWISGIRRSSTRSQAQRKTFPFCNSVVDIRALFTDTVWLGRLYTCVCFSHFNDNDNALKSIHSFGLYHIYRVQNIDSDIRISGTTWNIFRCKNVRRISGELDCGAMSIHWYNSHKHFVTTMRRNHDPFKTSTRCIYSGCGLKAWCGELWAATNNFLNSAKKVNSFDAGGLFDFVNGDFFGVRADTKGLGDMMAMVWLLVRRTNVLNVCTFLFFKGWVRRWALS